MKVFCIGLSRTGTTSMSHALTTLGYKSLHYPDTDDVVMKTLHGRFDWDVLDEYDAFADAPIAAFYRELDKQAPGSKFIMTVRGDVLGWLDSCSKKIKTTEDRYDELSAKLVYSTVVRTALYGRPYYCPENYVQAYYRHIEEVGDYFTGRQEDLLVMNVNQGWEPLCEFLGTEVPEEDFPSLRRSTGVYK